MRTPRDDESTRRMGVPCTVAWVFGLDTATTAGWMWGTAFGWAAWLVKIGCGEILTGKIFCTGAGWSSRCWGWGFTVTTAGVGMIDGGAWITDGGWSCTFCSVWKSRLCTVNSWQTLHHPHLIKCVNINNITRGETGQNEENKSSPAKSISSESSWGNSSEKAKRNLIINKTDENQNKVQVKPTSKVWSEIQLQISYVVSIWGVHDEKRNEISNSTHNLTNF